MFLGDDNEYLIHIDIDNCIAYKITIPISCNHVIFPYSITVDTIMIHVYSDCNHSGERVT